MSAAFWDRNAAFERLYAPAEWWKFVLRKDPCAYCNQPGAHADHIVPRSKGGADAWWNLTGACARCNMRKGAKLQFVTEALKREAQEE